MSTVGQTIIRTGPLLVFAAALVLTAAKAKQCAPTPVELLCEQDSDCGGVPPVDCTGAWACVDAGCEFVCEPDKVLCASSSQCAEGEYCTTEDGACDSACAPGAGGCGGVCMGECVPKPLETFCSWDGDCPEGQVCVYAFGGFAAPADPCPDPGCGAPPPQGMCKTPDLEVCDGVDNDLDGLVDEGCQGECSADADCPEGYECIVDPGGCPALAPPGADAMPCKPPTSSCVPIALQCVSDLDCPPGTVCTNSFGGACPPCPPGEACEPCGIALGWCEPWAEQCDGQDNDGDGLVDEGGVCPTDECQADSDCLPGQICTTVQLCWDACDPNGNCWGGCGPQNLCMAP